MALLKRKQSARRANKGRAIAGREGRARAIAGRVAYCALIFALCAVFPLFVSGPVGYVPLFMMVLLVAVSFVYVRLLVPALDYAQATLYRECIRGEEGQITVAVRNTSRLLFFRLEPTFVICDMEGAVTEVIRTRTMLGARASHEFRIDARFDHIGTYSAGLSSIEVFDLLGLFSKTIVVEERCSVRVIPQIQQLERIGVTELTTTENMRSVKSVLSDDMDYAYVRDYEFGDPMKTVHWKLSARQEDHLYTKLFESHTNPGITVFFDFFSSETDPERRLSMFDVMVETGFSVIDYAQRAGIESSLVFREASDRIVSTSQGNVEELDLLIDRMPRLNDGIDPRAACDMMESELRNPDAQANFMLFTSELSTQNVEGLLRMKVLHRGLRVFFVMPKGLSAAEKQERMRPMRRLAQAQVRVAALESSERAWEVTQ